MFRRLKLVVGAAIAVMLAGFPTSAMGSTEEVLQERADHSKYAQQLDDFWADNGVPEQTRADLVEKVMRGDRPDSLTPGEEPVSSRVDQVGELSVTTLHVQRRFRVDRLCAGPTWPGRPGGPRPY